MQSVAPNIFYETIYPGVTLGAVIMPRGTLMIDAPLRAEDARTWKSVLLTHSRGTHRLLLNLDGHEDRTLGARYMDCTVLAQQNVLEAFNNRTSVFKGHVTGSCAEWENYPEVSGTRWSIPSLTFSDRINFHWGEEAEIIIEHHPGPSPGASWVIVPSEKVVFIGDAIYLDQPPFLAASDLPNWIHTLSELRSPRYRNYTIISGRGGPVSIEYVRDQHEQIKSLHKKLDLLADKGASYLDTENLIKPFLRKLEYPAALQNTFEQRLRYGLEQYYQRHYFPVENEIGV
jgi:glyoxylase-like metal-dependent hydrolase (beta-lactamase superfamily II)